MRECGGAWEWVASQHCGSSSARILCVYACVPACAQDGDGSLRTGEHTLYARPCIYQLRTLEIFVGACGSLHRIQPFG